LSALDSEPAPAPDEPSKEAPRPIQFSLSTLLAITAACSLCLTFAILSADPIVLPALLGVLLMRAIFTHGPRRRIQIYVSAAVGATVTLLACITGWKIATNDVTLAPRESWFIDSVSHASFLEFVIQVAPLNSVRSYAASGVLAFFLCFQMLKQPTKSSEHLAQRMSTLVVIVTASFIVATIMGCEHFPAMEHH
jgi:hypothetical protein